MKKILSLMACWLCLGCQPKEPSLDGRYVLPNVPEEAEVTLEIKEGRIAGQSGINRYFGDISYKTPNIKIQIAGVTMMAGPEDLMLFEQEYLADLQAADTFQTAENALVLKTPEGKVLSFTKEVSQEEN